MRTMRWRVVSLRYLWLTSRRTKSTLSARSVSVWMKSRERTAWPTFTVSISRLTSWGPSFANGRLLLKPMWLWRQRTTIWSVSSPLDLRNVDQIRLKRPHTPLLPRFEPFDARWLTLSNERLPAAPWPNWLQSLSRKLSVVRSRNPPSGYTLCKMCVLVMAVTNHGTKLTCWVQVHIRKVKLLKAPKFDLGALMALHGESGTDDQGQKVEREFKERVLAEV